MPDFVFLRSDFVSLVISYCVSDRLRNDERNDELKSNSVFRILVSGQIVTVGNGIAEIDIFSVRIIDVGFTCHCFQIF